MPAVVKRTKTWKDKLPPGKSYPIDDALKLVKEFATAKFNESVDVSVNLGVDATKFDKCLDSDEKAKVVEANKQAGAKVGVTGTPAFFINGYQLTGAQPIEVIRPSLHHLLALGQILWIGVAGLVERLADGQP